MHVSLKNRFRPTLDALEDRFLPSTVLGPRVAHHGHHAAHHAHEANHIEIQRGADDVAAEQEMNHGGRHA